MQLKLKQAEKRRVDDVWSEICRQQSKPIDAVEGI